MKKTTNLLSSVVLMFTCLVSWQTAVAQMTPVGESVHRSRTITLPADQPWASYWHPDDLLTWSPFTDPDAPYNRSHTPLRDRFLNDDTRVNTHARPDEARISPLSIFNATSGNPSQGSLELDYYAFNYWQYTEVLVFWGGSAGEGLILAPNPGVIDAAHRNGVPVLGTIFFPPTAYGGQIQWVWDLVQGDGTTFPVADKLIEVAEYYGFDGYFVNQETAGGNSALADLVIDFMKYYQEHSSLEIMWYDAMTESGGVSWQEQLNAANDRFFQDGDDLVSEYMFLDFGWSAYDLQSSRTHAHSLGRSEFDLYAGIDVQANGYGTYANWSAIFPEGEPHVTSLGLYVPSWTYHGAGDHTAFYERANRFWVGANRDPSNTATTDAWKGLAHYVPANSVINDLPFTTNFCTGQGYDFYVDGQRLSHPGWSAQGWNNISLQDLLPTWRWLNECFGVPLTTEFDWSDGYYGGNCLKLSGSSMTNNHLKLYKTDLPVAGDTRIDLAYKRGSPGATRLKLGLSFVNDPGNFVHYDVADATSGGWHLQTFDISAHAGERIAIISLLVTGDPEPDYQMKVGRLSVHDGTPAPPAPPFGVYVENRFDESDFITLRLRWEHSPDAISYYNIYRRNPDLTRTYLGGTPNSAYFVPEVHHVVGDSLVTIEVEAVGLDFTPSSPATTSILWSPPPEQAGDPDPVDGASDVIRNTHLTWEAGLYAELHAIHLGTSSPPPYVTTQTATEFDPGDLAANTTYFWRIDESNPSGSSPGVEWRFTTGNAFADTLGYTLQFDGQNDLVNCGNDPSLQVTGSQITLEARINAVAWRDNVWQGNILGKEQAMGGGNDAGYMLRAGNDGQLNFNLGSGSWNEISSSAGVMDLDTWYHVAGTYDGNTMRLYLDGEPVAQSTRSLSIANALDVDLLLGNSPAFTDRVFDGLIDEVRIWDVARSAEQLQATMNVELSAPYYATPDSGLVGYWQLDEGSGQTAMDRSYAGNHGTLGSSTGSDPYDPVWVPLVGVVTATPAQGDEESTPPSFALGQNFPNPFNPTTTIRYDLPAGAPVSLKIYNIQGREIRTLVADVQGSGVKSVTWDGRDGKGEAVGSGIYFYRIRAGSWSECRKMVLLR